MTTDDDNDEIAVICLRCRGLDRRAGRMRPGTVGGEFICGCGWQCRVAVPGLSDETTCRRYQCQRRASILGLLCGEHAEEIHRHVERLERRKTGRYEEAEDVEVYEATLDREEYLRDRDRGVIDEGEDE